MKTDPMDMDDFSARLRRERAVVALMPLFFASGATSLVYQVLWTRELHLVFGTSTFAIATVLTAFMLGLAIGGWMMGRVADRVRRPLEAYGLLEGAIGLYAVLFPWLMVAIAPVYLTVWRWFEPPPLVFGMVQFVLVGALLVLPTAAMGATLPLLARFATLRMAAAGDRIGTLYGLNTAGAVFGTWLCGFVLLPGIGRSSTTWLVAVANLLLCAAAIGLDRWSRGSEAAEVEEDLPAPVLPKLALVATVAGLAGFSSLVYEVAWFRVLGLMLGASAYAFTLMLLAFLIGIAGGGWMGGRAADVALARGGQSGVLRLLGALQVGVAVLSFGLMYAYQEMPFWYVWVYDALGANRSPMALWTLSMALSVLVMTPPAWLMGMSFPVAVRAVLGDADELGAPVGKIYAANTAGGVLGAGLAGFVLLPLLHVQYTVFLAAGINLVGAMVAIIGTRGDRGAARWMGGAGLTIAALAVLAVVATPPWDKMIMTAGMYKYVSEFDDHSRQGILDYTIGQYDLLYYDEGLSSVVTVAQNKTSRNIWLANNGKVEASTTIDMPTQVMVSLLPFMYTSDEDDVLVIGLASGITAGAVTLVDDVERLDVVELEPAVVEAARFFNEDNYGVLEDPRTHLILNDGRNHLLLADAETYDLIVSEPSNPWISGVSNLFTLEFLRMGKSRLKPGGVWSQWIQMYGMDDNDLASLLATFAEVYPHVLLFMTVDHADLVLVGSDRPLELDRQLWNAMRERHPKVAAAFDQVDMADWVDIVGQYVLDRHAILEMAGDVELNTDDNMRIEYSAPLNLHKETGYANVNMLLSQARVPAGVVDGPTELMELSRRYMAQDDWDRNLEAMIRSLETAEDYPDQATVWIGKARDLADRDEWVQAIGMMHAAVRVMKARDEPPFEVIEAWEDWRARVLDFLGEDEEEEQGKTRRAPKRLSPVRAEAFDEELEPAETP